MYYMNFMERDQIKSALINCASTHSISLSELASESGIAPATLTGFVNDSKSGNRDRHTLSMTTIGKLTKRWPDLADHLKIANPTSSVRQVPYIGMIDRLNGHTVGPLEPNQSGSIMLNSQRPDYVAYGIKAGHPIIKSRIFLCKPEPVYDDFDNYLDRLCVVDCHEGRHMGYLMKSGDGKYWLAAPYNENESKQPDKTCDCTKINWLQPVEWIRP